MSKHRFVKPEASNIRGLCVFCGNNPQKSKGNGMYKPLCSPCDKYHFGGDGRQKRGNRKGIDLLCSICGFTSEYRCQFDVDHIDGNHSDDSPENLQVLCANCHRLKTLLNKDGSYKKAP